MVKFIKKYVLLIAFIIFDSLIFIFVINSNYGIMDISINNMDDVAIGFSGFLTDTHIEIYDKNGKFKKNIELNFTETFLLSYEEGILKVLYPKGSTRYNYDFNGNLLAEHPYEDQEYDLLYSEQDIITTPNKEEIISSSGDKYLLTSKFGYAKLTKVFSNGDKKIIWETGVGKYIFKVICIIMIYIASLTVLIKIYPYFPRKKSQNVIDVIKP